MQTVVAVAVAAVRELTEVCKTVRKKKSTSGRMELEPAVAAWKVAAGKGHRGHSQTFGSGIQTTSEQTDSPYPVVAAYSGSETGCLHL